MTKPEYIALGWVNEICFHQFSLGYGNFESFNRWNNYYDEKMGYWTSNALILHNYTDSTPAGDFRGEVYARSHGITLGWSIEPGNQNIAFYAGISFTAFINQISIQETNSKAFLYSAIDGDVEVPQGTHKGEVFIGHTEVKTVSDTKFTSLVPAVNLEAGGVFRLGNDLKLIPKINIGVYQRDNRIYTGTLFGRENILGGDVRPSIQLS